MKKAILLIFIFSACSNPKPVALLDFDSQSFKTDRGACNKVRSKYIEALKSQKDKLLGISENQLISTLGRYDYQILDRRNEKVFIYFLASGPQCAQMQTPSTSLRMLLKLNSVSLVKEVLFLTNSEI
jgi:hypothetical protein